MNGREDGEMIPLHSARKYNTQLPYGGVICTMGTVKYRKDRNLYYVSWGDSKVYRYKGFVCRDGVMYGLTGRQMAEKLLHLIQGDFETNPKAFRIEKYTEQRVDTIPYLREWLKAVAPTLSPATAKDYKNSVENHLIPWFKSNPVHLHEIEHDTLCQILVDVKRTGKGKLNVLYCLRACLDFAWRSKRIPAIPPFPKRKKYGIQDKKPAWIPEDRQRKIIEAIPVTHQSIFWWLKYHYRRPSEACALQKTNYRPESDSFTIRWSFSNRQLVDHTKTHKEHSIPCHPEFRRIMAAMPATFGPFFFENTTRDCKTKKAGRHYTVVGLESIWDAACIRVGEVKINEKGKEVPAVPLYVGTKHSSCSQFINEKGGTIDELQMLTDHARRDSVLQYADVQLDRKRQLMGRVVQLPQDRPKKKSDGSSN